MRERVFLFLVGAGLAVSGITIAVMPWAAARWGTPVEGVVQSAFRPRRGHGCHVSVQYQAREGYAPSRDLTVDSSLCWELKAGDRVRLLRLGKKIDWVVLEDDGGYWSDGLVAAAAMIAASFLIFSLLGRPAVLLLPLLLLPSMARAQEAEDDEDERPGIEAKAEDGDGDEGEEEEGDEEEPGHRVEVGLRGSRGREANTRDWDWGPTLSWEVLTTRSSRANRFRYELEASYNDASTKLDGDETNQSTRVRTVEFRYAKLSVLELFGFDLRKRINFVPYVAGGVQHTDSFQTSTSFNEDDEVYVTENTRERYWSPSFGVGGEVELNKRVSLAIDYNQNTERYDKRITRLSVELKVAILGERRD